MVAKTDALERFSHIFVKILWWTELNQDFIIALPKWDQTECWPYLACLRLRADLLKLGQNTTLIGFRKGRCHKHALGNDTAQKRNFKTNMFAQLNPCHVSIPQLNKTQNRTERWTVTAARLNRRRRHIKPRNGCLRGRTPSRNVDGRMANGEWW